MDALVCKVGGDTFIVPSRDVVEIYMPKVNDVVELPDGRETVDVRGEVHSLLRLADLLGLTPEVTDIEMAQAIVVPGGANTRPPSWWTKSSGSSRWSSPASPCRSRKSFHVPILGYGMMGESDALVIDNRGNPAILPGAARHSANLLTCPPP